MALKKLNVKAEETKPTGSNIPEAVTTLNLAVYNRAAEQLKDAEALVEELKPDIQVNGLREIADYNVKHPLAPVTSVRLVAADGTKTMVSAQNRYKQANAEVADAAFTLLGKDINQYVHETIKPSIDASFFNDANGAFDQKTFDAVNTALQVVALKFGKTNPLSIKKIVVPKAGFHESRWTEFPTVAAQMSLFEAVPLTVNVKP